jgi:predicted RecA/RadA family phage recombinase
MSLTFEQNGSMIDYTPGSAVDAGDAVALGGGLLGIAHLDIAASDLGAVAVDEYAYYVTKETTTDVMTVGQLIYLDSTLLLATATPTATFLGVCVKASGATDTTVLVKKAPAGVAKPGLQVASKVVTRATMTDNAGTATGYIDMASGAIPANSLIVGWKLVTTTAFIGDVSAVAEVGISGDTDAFSSVTMGSCFTTGTIGSQAKDGVAAFRAAATTPRLTITGNADFTSISAGEAILYVYYFIFGD